MSLALLALVLYIYGGSATVVSCWRHHGRPHGDEWWMIPIVFFLWPIVDDPSERRS